MQARLNYIGEGPHGTQWNAVEDRNTLEVIGVVVAHPKTLVTYVCVNHDGMVVMGTAPSVLEARVRIEEEYDHHH
jgi:hypothetical protein